MKKYPFWVIKRDALRLLKGKWNAVVLSLFIPFLLFVVFVIKLSQAAEGITSQAELEPFFLYQTIATLVFSIILDLIFVGIYRNLQPQREKASCPNIYLVGLQSTVKMLPTLCIKYLVPLAVSFLFTSELVTWFYDYLMFSLMDYQIYLIVVEVVALAIDIFTIYLSLSLLLAPCILANHPEYGGIRLIKESFSYARGNRFYLIFLSVSFFGWFLLGSLAFTIGILWAMAYMMTAHYAYYRRLAFGREAISEIQIEE